MSLKQVLVIGMAVVLAASCSGDDEGDDTTTTTLAESGAISTLATAGGDADTSATSTTTTTTTTTTVAPELAFPEYRIVSREAGDNGDTVVVLLDPTTYESLSDIDIHNVMSDLVEQFAPVFEAHIVETQAAADALFVDDPTEEQTTELATSYIARLEDGFRIVYVGRFEESGVAILGS